MYLTCSCSAAVWRDRFCHCSDNRCLCHIYSNLILHLSILTLTDSKTKIWALCVCLLSHMLIITVIWPYCDFSCFWQQGPKVASLVNLLHLFINTILTLHWWVLIKPCSGLSLWKSSTFHMFSEQNAIKCSSTAHIPVAPCYDVWATTCTTCLCPALSVLTRCDTPLPAHEMLFNESQHTAVLPVSITFLLQQRKSFWCLLRLLLLPQRVKDTEGAVALKRTFNKSDIHSAFLSFQEWGSLRTGLLCQSLVVSSVHTMSVK